MDPLSDFLDGPRARSAFLLRVVMRPPWSIAVADEAPLSLVTNLGPPVRFRPGDGAAAALGTGDVLLVRSPGPYRLASQAGGGSEITIGPGQECSGADGRDLSAVLSTGVRSWGNDPSGPDRLLVGTYRTEGEVGRMLLSALPGHLVAPDPAPEVVALVDAELGRTRIGQGSTLDRLLDLLLIATVRAWAAQGRARTTWLAASRDPVVHAGIRLMHDFPERPWTLQALAGEAGVSRAAFSRRFRDVVGVAPMTYLTRWRLALGADLVRDDRLTLDGVAHRVGYASGFAFSAAFKRAYGTSPDRYRRAVRPPADRG